MGKELAKRLSWRFIDSDEEIQKREGKSISEMVKERGWEYFREREREFLRRLFQMKEVVVALGGGGVLHEKEMEILKREGIIFFLDVPEEELIKRIKDDPKSSKERPSLKKQKSLEEEVREVLKERLPLYKRYSHFRITNYNKGVKEVINEILREVESYVQTDC